MDFFFFTKISELKLFWGEVKSALLREAPICLISCRKRQFRKFSIFQFNPYWLKLKLVFGFRSLMCISYMKMGIFQRGNWIFAWNHRIHTTLESKHPQSELHITFMAGNDWISMLKFIRILVMNSMKWDLWRVGLLTQFGGNHEVEIRFVWLLYRCCDVFEVHWLSNGKS